MFHHPAEVAAKLVQMPDADDGLHRLFQRLQRIAPVTTRFANIVRNRRSSGQHHVIGQGYVRGDNRAATRYELPADLGGAARHETGRVETVLSKIAVVRNVTDIVQLGTGSNVRGGERSAIEGNVPPILSQI